MQKNGYHFIYESLLSRIECHALAPGMQLPSEKDLVNEFGASRMTVRRALTRLEEDGRIFRRSGVGSFVKVPGTSESSGARRVEIGVEVHPEWGAPRSFMTEVLSASQKACAECNCNLLLRSKEELLAGENVDAAFFLFLDAEDFPQASRLAARKPTLLLNRVTDDPNLGYVAVDYAAAVAQVVRRMLQNGAGKILFAGGSMTDRNYAPFMRELGYRRAHEILGIPVREELIISWDDCREYEKIAQRLEAEQPDVIFVSCEYHLSRVYTACEKCDGRLLRKPYVFCFDDVQDCASFPSGSISYGRIPFGDMCRRAVRYLAGRVNRELPDQAIREIFTMSYIVNNCPFLI
ncbi:GntR family transcriptional regulator [Victivallis vadensis]|jgi:regulatory protein gntR HTH|uniref:GntR family transcriptional regulator n=2 Tax=Victivallis vadensis TaxID=172901 RepID=A0A848B4Y7_9BACT|nr:GntR family transcriptional regulator [Victivallis vadensis]NMD88730.1 GntR family transcriptional regulator [Victivallis vadensis]